MFLESVKLPLYSLSLYDPAVGEEPNQGPRTNASCGNDFDWARSSIGTQPCLIAAEVLAACNQSDWNLPSLVDDIPYPPPNAMTANPCFCSWSAYNLLSACSACQGHEEQIHDWSSYQLSCSPLGLSEVYFPKSISSSVLIPYWATLKPTLWDNHRFNLTEAHLHANQYYDDYVPRVFNWKSSMAAPGAPRTSQLIGGVLGLLGGLAGIMFAFDLVLYAVYRRKQRRPGDHSLQAGRATHSAVALTSPPFRRHNTAITIPDTPEDSERTRRLPFTPIFI